MHQQINIEELATIIVDTAFHIHREFGPGLLESVYELILARTLEKKGLTVERQKTIEFSYEGITIDNAYRLDLLINNQIIIEVKATECNLPIHQVQLTTYLRLMRIPLGLLLNFGMKLMKDGIKRVVNEHIDFTSSGLRIHQDNSPNKM